MIDGEFGGNQDWFHEYCYECWVDVELQQHVTALFIWQNIKGMKKLYPFDLEQMDKEAYKIQSDYETIHPSKSSGCKKPEWYIEGLAKYIFQIM